MTNPRPTIGSSRIAIAALLALSPATLLAQDMASTGPGTEAAPPIDGPIVSTNPIGSEGAQPSASTSTAPVLVIPESLPSPTPKAEAVPVVQEPSASESTVPVTTAKPAPRTAAQSTTTSSTTSSPPAPPASEGSQPAEDGFATSEATTDAVPPPALVSSPASELAANPADSQPTPGQEQDVTTLLGAALFLLVLLLLGIGSLLLIRSSRRKAMAERVVRPAVPATAKPVTTVREEVGAPVDVPAAPVTYAATPLRTRSGRAGRTSGVVLPREIPSSFEERDALLKRMIDAKPDKANPFTDRRARLKRARLILQSLGREFRTNEPWIDLSDYPENWPALSRRPARAA